MRREFYRKANVIRKSTRGQSTIKNKERGGVGQILTRICVSRERLGEAIYFVNNKKTASPFHQSILVCIKQIMAGKPSSAVVCCFKVSFTIK